MKPPEEKADADRRLAEQLLSGLRPNEFALKDLFRKNLRSEDMNDVYDNYCPLPEHPRLDLEEILRSGSAARRDYDFGVREALLISSFRRATSHLDDRGDWIQLFCCAALLQMGARAPLLFLGEPETLAEFTMQSLQLGGDVLSCSASMLAWRYLANTGINDDPLYLALAILLLALSAGAGDERGVLLGSLAGWVLNHDTCEDDRPLFAFAGPKWRSLVWKVIVNASRPHPIEAVEGLSTIGKLVLWESSAEGN